MKTKEVKFTATMSVPEHATDEQALAFIATHLNGRSVDDCLSLTDIQVLSDTECSGIVSLLDTKIKDWELYSESNDVPVDRQCEYALKISHNETNGQVYFSVYNSMLDEVRGDDFVRLGLHGLLEIRNGFPAISLGVSPDQNNIHVISNTSSVIAVMKGDNCAHDAKMERLDSVNNQGQGLSFPLFNFSENELNRKLIAEHLFMKHDFGDAIVEADNGWQYNDNEMTKVIFLFTGGECTIKKTITVKFAEYGTHVISFDVN